MRKVGWPVVLWSVTQRGVWHSAKFPLTNIGHSRVAGVDPELDSSKEGGKFVHVTSCSSHIGVGFFFRGTRKSWRTFSGEILLGFCMNLYRSAACAGRGDRLVAA
jgi:hypothetical protein